MHPHRHPFLVVGTALLLVLTGCGANPSASGPDTHGSETSTSQETTAEQSPVSDADTNAQEATVPVGAYAASADFPFPVPEGWTVLDDFTEGKLGKDVTMDGSIEYPGEAEDAAATYLGLLKEAGFDAYTYAPGEVTNQASLAAEGVINGTRYLAILNFDVHADGHQRVSITATEKN